MNKHPINHTPKEIDLNLESQWEENPSIQWLFEHGKIILYSILIALTLLFTIYRMNLAYTGHAEADYIEADNNFQLIAEAPGSQEAAVQKEALEKLQLLMKRHPDLHTKYDGALAQILLNRGEMESAQEYANLAIARTTAANQPFYTKYAQTSLLIANQQYNRALEEALLLQEQMKTQESLGYSDILFAFNLLRIAFLQQQLDLKTDEVATWQQWKEFASKSEDPALAQALTLFNEGTISLNNYIEAREQLLKK